MTLTMRIEREVKPEEITGMIYGTGALSWEWWVECEWLRDGERMFISDHETSEALETDTFRVVVDDPDEKEGSGIHRIITLTMEDLVRAAALAIKAGHVYEKDAINEDLGYCDASEADCVLQWAVFGREPVYG